MEKIWNAIVNFFTKMGDELESFIGQFGWKIVSGLITIILGFILIKIIKKIIKKLLYKSKIDKTALAFILSVITAILYIMYIYIVAYTLGIPMDSFVAIIASCGVAIGLALKDSLSNIANGLLLIINKPFEVGNYVKINGEEGTVRAIKLTTTEIVTPDNKIINVPNNSVTGSSIVNFNAFDTRRLDFTFSAAYGTDLEKVKALLIKIATEHPQVLKDPAPQSRLALQNASSLDFMLRVWVKAADYWNVKFDITETVINEFAKNKIEIPYNKLDVNLTKEEK